MKFFKKSEGQLTYFNIIILVLSVYVLIALLIDSLFHLPPEVHKLLHYIDTGICFFFFLDFVIRFRQAENKWKFMRWGWIDLLASIPAVDFLRTGRTLRLIRLLRILRAFRSASYIVRYAYHNKTKGSFATVVLFAILTVIFSAIAILQVETAPNSNIKTAEDALWWAYVTITTTGYGDHYPVTTEGRLIAAVLIATGAGLFGTFTGYVASWFVEERSEEPPKEEGR